MTDASAPTPTPAAPDIPAPTPEEIAALRARIAALEAPNPVVAAVKTGASATMCGVFKTGRATACVYRALNGIKTVLFFGVSLGLSLAAEFDAIDLTPLLSMVLPEGSKVSVAQAITLMSVAGILLRLVSKGPVFNRFRSATLDSGARVDTPAGG